MDNDRKCRQCGSQIDRESVRELDEHGLDMCMECAEAMMVYQYWG